MSTIERRNHGRIMDPELTKVLAIFALVGAVVTVLKVWGWALRREGLDDSRIIGRIIGPGTVPFPPIAGWVLLGIAVSAAALLITAAVLYDRGKGGPKRNAARVDAAAADMATPREFRRFTLAGRKREAKQKGIPAEPILLGKAVINGARIFTGIEDTLTAIFGPRTGKSTGYAIPLIMEALHNVVATSNKPDLVQKTRAFRESLGRVWVFDPQDEIGEPASWYWDPISYITGGPVNKRDIRARKLAHRFAFASGTHHTGGKDYFDQSAEGLITQLLLAAALLHKPVTTILDWLADETDLTPVHALERSSFHRQARALRKTMTINDRQQDGIYGTAATMTEFLQYETIQPWITPDRNRPAFDPEQFVRSVEPQTLYSISREDEGSMGPIISALTIAVCDAAEGLANRSPGGRLERPLRLVLDEIANVCRWDQLPNLYSHYGSKGILPAAFLQSFEQGQEVWGDKGMGKLWSSSTIRLTGPGVAENGFLSSVSGMVGKSVYASHSASVNEKGSSRNVSTGETDTLDVSDLTAMDLGRVLMTATGCRPFLIKIVPSYERGYKTPKATEPPADTAPVLRLNAPHTTASPSASRGSSWLRD